jgi:TPP-dependent pyruvate/acetoin dehydrogenase alpha subunit
VQELEYSKEQLIQWYRQMVRIRFFEKLVEEKFLGGEIPGFVHLSLGQEAIAVGTCENLRKTDYITSTHRGHGHTIAKGAKVDRCMAELYGKRTGYCKGKGGSMHIADFSVGMLGANGVVGGGFNLAVGAGLSAQLNKTDHVAVCFFGDGASNRGTFHEALNMAAAWKLPVVFVCENNQWASTTHMSEVTSVEDLVVRAQAYAMPGIVVQGNNIFEVNEKTQEAIERARNGEGPTLIEAKTFRVGGHFVGDPEKYRTKQEVKSQTDLHDPLKFFINKVLEEGLLTNEELSQVEQEARQELDEALQFAIDSPYPDPKEAFEDLYI